MRDVQEIKEARTQSAVDALPQELFTKIFNLPTNGNGYHAGEDAHKPLHRFAGRLWETMLEFERTGALDLRSNKQSRRVCADARQFITEIKRILDDEQITFKLPAESGPIAAKAKKAIGA